MQLLQL